jgi:hypothetical protein
LCTNVSDEHAASIFAVEVRRVKMFIGFIGFDGESGQEGQSEPWGTERSGAQSANRSKKQESIILRPPERKVQ